VSMEAGEMIIHIESLEMNGKAMPEEVMSGIRDQNMADDVNKDPELQPVLNKITSINIQNGRLQIIPAKKK
jgi:hypothetical protein